MILIFHVFHTITQIRYNIETFWLETVSLVTVHNGPSVSISFNTDWQAAKSQLCQPLSQDKWETKSCIGYHRIIGNKGAYIWPQFMKWNAWALTHVIHNTWWKIRIILSCIIGTCNKAKEIFRNNSFISLSLSGTVDWRLWAIASPALHLIIPLLCFILVRCGWWPSLHHRRIDSLSLRARTKINQVVEESWEELLLCAKDLMDTRLEDGKELSSKLLWQGLSISVVKHISFTPKCHRLVWLLRQNWKLWEKHLWCCQGHDVKAAIFWR